MTEKARITLPRIEYEITPPKGLLTLDIAELWRFRDLLYIFVWRDIKVRYKQTALGVAWAVFQPLVTMIIFTIFFGRLAKVPSDGIAYPIFVYTGLLFWNYFSTALTSTSNSLIESESIIKKVYFPRLILPFSTVVTPLIDFGFAFLVLAGLMAYFRFVPGIMGIVAIPLLLLVSLATALGLGLFLAATNVKFRDVRYILPFFLQMLLFITPIIYPVSSVPAKYQFLLFINPMAGVTSLARATLLGTTPIDWHLLLISIISSVVLLLLGFAYFRRTERFFADIL